MYILRDIELLLNLKKFTEGFISRQYLSLMNIFFEYN